MNSKQNPLKSEARIAASRANGALSHGPKTAEGRRRVAFNAIRHGLTAQSTVLANESRERFQELFDTLVDELQPVGELEFGFVEEIVAYRWRLRRIWGVETALIDHEMDRQADHIEQTYDRIDEATRTALAFSHLADEKALTVVARYETRYLRALDRTLRNLRLAQAERLAADEAAAATADSTQVVEETAPQPPN
jgi:hypothetical protein